MRPSTRPSAPRQVRRSESVTRVRSASVAPSRIILVKNKQKSCSLPSGSQGTMVHLDTCFGRCPRSGTRGIEDGQPHCRTLDSLPGNCIVSPNRLPLEGKHFTAETSRAHTRGVIAYPRGQEHSASAPRGRSSPAWHVSRALPGPSGGFTAWKRRQSLVAAAETPWAERSFSASWRFAG